MKGEITMKNTYEKPEMTVEYFDVCDVIMASSPSAPTDTHQLDDVGNQNETGNFGFVF